jgi:hypothetical protein
VLFAARQNQQGQRQGRLAYAVALGGGAGNEFTNATPLLVGDGLTHICELCVVEAVAIVAASKKKQAGAEAATP